MQGRIGSGAAKRNSLQGSASDVTLGARVWRSADGTVSL